MTRQQFLQLCASTKNAGGFRAYRQAEILSHNRKTVHRVYLDPGLPATHKLIASSRSLHTAYEAVNRFNMWLIQSKQYRPDTEAKTDA